MSKARRSHEPRYEPWRTSTCLWLAKPPLQRRNLKYKYNNLNQASTVLYCTVYLSSLKQHQQARDWHTQGSPLLRIFCLAERVPRLARIASTAETKAIVCFLLAHKRAMATLLLRPSSHFVLSRAVFKLYVSIRSYLLELICWAWCY